MMRTQLKRHGLLQGDDAQAAGEGADAADADAVASAASLA